LLKTKYYPPKHKYHVTASVAISLGFPIGFLLLNVLTEHLMLKYDSNWPLVQRLYGSIAFMCLLLFSPFFTEAKAEKPVIKSTQTLMKFRDEVPLQLSPEQFSLLIKAIWLLGLMFNSCATTAIVTHLVLLYCLITKKFELNATSQLFFFSYFSLATLSRSDWTRNF
jgi:hypothetical protein